MINAVLYMIAALLFSSSATSHFMEEDTFSGVLNTLLAIITGAVSIIVAREER
jgi:hypothetical protein